MLHIPYKLQLLRENQLLVSSFLSLKFLKKVFILSQILTILMFLQELNNSLAFFLFL